jgi:transcriptional regulator with XRE-family HTH domain
MLRKRIDEATTQAAVAAELGVSEGYLSDVLRGHKEPARKLLKAMGLRRVVTYAEDAK